MKLFEKGMHALPILMVEILLVYSEDNRLPLERQQAIDPLLYGGPM